MREYISLGDTKPTSHTDHPGRSISSADMIRNGEHVAHNRMRGRHEIHISEPTDNMLADEVFR
jgi:hypothetical protein